jgi:hypothetical protein
MPSPAKLLTIAAVLIFAGFLLWTTLGAQQVECEVCVEYAGQRNCATASNETEEAALASAQMTACGPVASGMNDVIACQNRPPVTRQCRTR